MKNDNKRVDKRLISRLKLVVPLKKYFTLFYGHENHGKMTKKKAKCRQANMYKFMKKIALTWWDLNKYL
jgi:hypothetical protein